MSFLDAFSGTGQGRAEIAAWGRERGEEAENVGGAGGGNQREWTAWSGGAGRARTVPDVPASRLWDGRAAL